MVESINQKSLNNNLFFQISGTRVGVSVLSLVAVSACRSPFVPLDAEGNVIKGPLNNALVFFDYNQNGLLDSNEPFTRTREDGSFNLGGKKGYSFTVLTDETTVDRSSGEILSNVVLKAPEGSSVVTPTTTIMEETGLNGKQVGAILGLPEEVDPTQFNPFAENIDKDLALAVEKVSHQVMTTITAISSAIEGSGAESDQAFSVALGAVVDIVQQRGSALEENADADVSINFSSKSDIKTHLN